MAVVENLMEQLFFKPASLISLKHCLFMACILFTYQQTSPPQENNRSCSSIILMTQQKNIFLAGLLFCLSITSFSYGQQQTAVYDNISEAIKGYYQYLPQGYPAAGVKYPMILFVHGFGERGPGTPASLPLVLRNGIPKLINDGVFPTSFTVNGQTFRFIIVSPQFAATGFPSVNDINNMINYAVAKYPIDINRIYLTGLSMGGGVAWYYPGYNSYFSNRIAATVPVCGSTDVDANYANNIAASNLPVWATHNDGDPTVSVDVTNNMINLVNNRPVPPTPLAKKTIFSSNSHDAWTRTYDPNFRENNMNIYEWMLQYKRNFTVLPVTGLSFTAQQVLPARKVQLQWSTQVETNISGFRVMRSTDGIHFTAIGFVNASATGGNGASYQYTDEYPLAGKDFYRLEIRELNGDVNFSDIRLVNLEGSPAIIISPNPVKETMNLQTGFVLKNATLQIINSKGQLVYSTNINGSGNIPVQLGNLSPGVYVARIVDGENVEQVRFVKE